MLVLEDGQETLLVADTKKIQAYQHEREAKVGQYELV
jgi:hypothetical protein